MNTSTYEDPLIRKLSQSAAKSKERRAKELVEQQELQAIQERIQQHLLTMADLKAQIAVFKNADNGSNAIITKTTNTTSAKTVINPDALSAEEEQYKQSIVQKMVELIKKRKMK